MNCVKVIQRRSSRCSEENEASEAESDSEHSLSRVVSEYVFYRVGMDWTECKIRKKANSFNFQCEKRSFDLELHIGVPIKYTIL